MGLDNSAQMQIIVAVIVLALLWTLETVIPFLQNRQQRLKHSMRNIAIGVFNTIILAILFGPILLNLTEWTEINNLGLLHLVDLSIWATAILAVLLLDGWMYLWHRANHRVPLLWRFHKVHHSDPDMDASTAVRFHTGEILISAFLRLGIIVILGLSFWHILLYDLLLLPVILLHHGNIQFPEKLDKYYRSFFASPAMHRIHHSSEKIETDSNYGSIFSFWDRLANSFFLREKGVGVRYGLGELIGIKTESLYFLAMMPFHNPGLARTIEQNPKTLLAQGFLDKKF